MRPLPAAALLASLLVGLAAAPVGSLAAPEAEATPTPPSGVQAGPEPIRVPAFRLLDETGTAHALRDHLAAPAVVLITHGIGCPIVRGGLPRLRELHAAHAPEGIPFWFLNLNPQDSRAELREEARTFGVPIPILKDGTQALGRLLGLDRTAEALVVEPGTGRILYRGAIDDRLDYGIQRHRLHRDFLGDALAAVAAGRAPTPARTPVRGCLIHYAPLPESGPVPGLAPGPAPSYAREIAPILERRCRTCHHEGGAGPWAMTDHATVKAWGPMMREVVLSGRMPPWYADPEVGDFANDLSLQPDEKATLLAWLEAGAPPGEGEDPLLRPFPAPASGQWSLGEPDLVVEVPTQRIPATGPVDYRYWRTAIDVDEDWWVSAVELRPSNAAVMHHAFAFVLYPKHLRHRQPAWKRGLESFFAVYAPGTEPMALPEGTGLFLPEGSKLLFQMHYAATGRPEEDTPRLGIQRALARPPLELRIASAHTTRLRIPPGEPRHPVSATLRSPHPARIYGLQPHMHYRGHSVRYHLRMPDGATRELLNVPSYAFDWQTFYRLREPIDVPAGSTVRCDGVFDNSAANPLNPDPTAEVRYGLQSTDEMFICYVAYAELPASGSPVSGKPVSGKPDSEPPSTELRATEPAPRPPG